MEKTTWHTSMERPPKPVGGTFLELGIAKEFDGIEQARGKGNAQLPLFSVVANVTWPK